MEKSLGAATNSSVLGNGAHALERLRDLLAHIDALLIGGELVRDLHAAGLNGEVGLRGGDLGLVGIAVHGGEVAGGPAQEEIVNLALRATADFHHFVGGYKMVG